MHVEKLFINVQNFFPLSAVETVEKTGEVFHIGFS